MTAVTASGRRGTGRARSARTRMAWITWRQHRLALAGVAVLLGGCALVLAVTGLRMRAAYASFTAARCAPGGGAATSRCTSLWGAYYHAGYPLTGNLQMVVTGLLVIPLLIGMFVAAPLLAREYETGTFRFAWTQAAGPTRWVAVKLALLGGTLTAAGSAFGVLVSWWLTVQEPIWDGSRWQADQFGVTAVTFAAGTLLGFAVGAFVGALIRRTVPAMAATACSLAAIAVVTYQKLDPLLAGADPVTRRSALLNLLPYQPGSPPPTFVSGQAVTVSAPPGSWPLRAWFTGPHGRTAAFPSLQQRYLAAHHLTLWIAYEPAGRFWLLQCAEGAGCLLLALLLGAATVWLVRRKAA